MSKVNTIIEKIDAILGKLEGNAPYNQVLPIVRGLHTDIKAEFGHLIEVVAPTPEPAPAPEPVIESIPTPAPVIEVEEETAPEVQEETVEVEAEKPAPKKSRTSTAKSE